MSLGSVCRLLLARELQERPVGHLKMVTRDKGHRSQGWKWAGGVVGCLAPRMNVCGRYLQMC